MNCVRVVSLVFQQMDLISVELGTFDTKFKIQPSIRISSDNGYGANLIAVMAYERQYKLTLVLILEEDWLVLLALWIVLVIHIN